MKTSDNKKRKGGEKFSNAYSFGHKRKFEWRSLPHKDTNGLNSLSWEKGYSAWLSHLTDIIERDDQGFLKEINTNEHLTQWIQSVLEVQLD
ncbi:unnamed protein product [Cunninghamella blakesleeana]